MYRRSRLRSPPERYGKDAFGYAREGIYDKNSGQINTMFKANRISNKMNF
jgi:hypothetical protein